jgi:drug/metabolite transporter (DMT)-like permease
LTAASLLDFLGLECVSARLGRLIMFLYPTLVVILPAVFLAKPATRREIAALELPTALWWCAILLATACTALPVFLVVEALKRIGANHLALTGALVISGVLLFTLERN